MQEVADALGIHVSHRQPRDQRQVRADARAASCRSSSSSPAAPRTRTAASSRALTVKERVREIIASEREAPNPLSDDEVADRLEQGVRPRDRAPHRHEVPQGAEHPVLAPASRLDASRAQGRPRAAASSAGGARARPPMRRVLARRACASARRSEMAAPAGARRRDAAPRGRCGSTSSSTATDFSGGSGRRRAGASRREVEDGARARARRAARRSSAAGRTDAGVHARRLVAIVPHGARDARATAPPRARRACCPTTWACARVRDVAGRFHALARRAVEVVPLRAARRGDEAAARRRRACGGARGAPDLRGSSARAAPLVGPARLRLVRQRRARRAPSTVRTLARPRWAAPRRAARPSTSWGTASSTGWSATWSARMLEAAAAGRRPGGARPRGARGARPPRGGLRGARARAHADGRGLRGTTRSRGSRANRPRFGPARLPPAPPRPVESATADPEVPPCRSRSPAATWA